MVENDCKSKWQDIGLGSKDHLTFLGAEMPLHKKTNAYNKNNLRTNNNNFNNNIFRPSVSNRMVDRKKMKQDKKKIIEEFETLFYNSFRLAKVELEEKELKKVVKFFKIQLNKLI